MGASPACPPLWPARSETGGMGGGVDNGLGNRFLLASRRPTAASYGGGHSEAVPLQQGLATERHMPPPRAMAVGLPLAITVGRGNGRTAVVGHWWRWRGRVYHCSSQAFVFASSRVSSLTSSGLVRGGVCSNLTTTLNTWRTWAVPCIPRVPGLPRPVLHSVQCQRFPGT